MNIDILKYFYRLILSFTFKLFYLNSVQYKDNTKRKLINMKIKYNMKINEIINKFI